MAGKHLCFFVTKVSENNVVVPEQVVLDLHGAIQKDAGRDWTERDQERASRQWGNARDPEEQCSAAQVA